MLTIFGILGARLYANKPVSARADACRADEILCEVCVWVLFLNDFILQIINNNKTLKIQLDVT